jgi:predicted RNA-binding protein with PIN domain
VERVADGAPVNGVMDIERLPTDGLPAERPPVERLPVERLIVDAMNVIGSRPTGWWHDRAGATRRLVGSLHALAAAGGAIELTVVVDGRPVEGLPEGEHGPLLVLYAARRGPDAADDRIVELVAADVDPSSLRIVTSDRALRNRVRALGGEVVGASALLRRLDALPRESTAPREGA